MTLLVGTASWTDKTLLESGRFYPESAKSPEARLRFYASQFNLVEVDTSYYAIPSVTTAQHWAERTPPGFVFNVKAFSLFTGQWTSTDVLPKDIKQALGAGRRMVYKDMAEELREELWRRFAACLVPLRANSKLGLVHFQFAPKVFRHKAAIEHLEHCLEHLPGHTLSIEFRNPSWWESTETTAETLAMLRKLGMGLLQLAPRLMKTLSVVGTAAMFMVGGGILLHGWPALGHAVEAYASTLGSLAAPLINAAAGAGVGVLAGAAIVALVAGVQRLRR